MDGTKTQLPYEIVEIILSRLPAKSLFRFKSVSKSWAATISDQRFAGLHLRQSRKSSGNQDIFFWCEYKGWKYDSQVKVSEIPKHIKTKMKLDHLEQKLDPIVLCYCDGLALRRYRKTHHNKYVLSNLSTGLYTEFTCPHEIFYQVYDTVYGICYDPVINDYKVVIINFMHYVVYYCRTNRWSEMKEVAEDFWLIIMGRGVSLNGDLYFILKTEQDWGVRIKIVGFDPTEEKFVTYPETRYGKKESTFMYMTCLEGYLYLCFNDRYCQMIKVREKGDDDYDEEEVMWKELKGRPPFFEDVNYDLLINVPEDRTVLRLGHSYSVRMGYQRVPYLENLFIGGPKQVIKKRRWKPIDDSNARTRLGGQESPFPDTRKCPGTPPTRVSESPFQDTRRCAGTPPTRVSGRICN